jgi:DNA repair exonuclease SbcCD ATPase subunit
MTGNGNIFDKIRGVTHRELLGCNQLIIHDETVLADCQEKCLSFILKYMDERKKTIRELEDKEREVSRSVNLMLEDFGESLLVRIGEDESVFPPPLKDSACLGEYRRLLKEISDSGLLIQDLEADMARLKELEGQIARKEDQGSGQTKNLSGSYVRLGVLVLEDPLFEDFSDSYKHQLEAMLPKIRSLEERLEDLEGKDGGGLLGMIGKNAQSMVIRSFLGKSRENLERLYGEAGKRFVLAGLGVSASGEIPLLIEEIEDGRKVSSDIAAELALLREERRKIGDAFGAEGGPAKRIRVLERHIGHTREELRGVYLNFGGQAADPSLREQCAGFYTDEDLLLLERIDKGRDTLGDYEIQIGKLKASLEIDEERTEIEKLNRAIEDHKQRIAAGERAVADLEDRIERANRHIGELTLLLDKPPQN